jgi:hypothetical protein
MWDLDTIGKRNELACRRCTKCGTLGETKPNHPYLVGATPHDAHPVLAYLCAPCCGEVVEGRAFAQRVRVVVQLNTNPEAWDGCDVGEQRHVFLAGHGAWCTCAPCAAHRVNKASR